MTLVSTNPRLTGTIGSPKAAVGSPKPIKLADVSADKKMVVPADVLNQAEPPLWCISARLLGANASNSAKVARVEEAFRKENPAINCAARDFGRILVAGDEVIVPNIEWVAGAPKPRPGNLSQFAAQAKTQTEMNAAAVAERTARVRTTLLTNLQVAVSFVKENESLNPGQRNLVASLVAQAERLGEALPISADDLRQLKLASAEPENTNPSDVYGA